MVTDNKEDFGDVLELTNMAVSKVLGSFEALGIC
jgi:hypothetical protein